MLPKGVLQTVSPAFNCKLAQWVAGVGLAAELPGGPPPRVESGGLGVRDVRHPQAADGRGAGEGDLEKYAVTR